ncbi:PhoH-like protein [bioreactor metagenome]|uniref:PhoH-like protein n=1 Tax=bioreactor metagenome TaxID=1076179 RepID=A0A644WRP2_9ZZZZ
MASSEQVFDLQFIDHTAFYGVGDSHLNQIRSFFPKLKIIARGDMVKVIGTKTDIEVFAERFQNLLKHFDIFGDLKTNDIAQIMGGEDISSGESLAQMPADVIVYGRSGQPIKARTRNQQKMVEKLQTSDMMFAVGPAGTGKTYTAVALAVKYLKEKKVRRIVLTRPAVEAGENLGFLPGDLREKLDPYLQPLYDALNDMLPQQKLLGYFDDGTIEIAPLAFMRGRTLEKSFVILDEAQNATRMQMKMFLTRMGQDSKFVITGDMTQIDLPRTQASGLIHAVNMVKNIPEISIIKLDQSDVIRHPIVTKIINAYENELDNENNK